MHFPLMQWQYTIRKEAAENHIQHHIAKQRLKITHLQKEAGQKYLQHGIKGETHADAAAAENSHRNI